MKKTTWNTYRISGYTYQVGDDPRACGGVHRHEVRCTRARVWQVRVVDSNGRYSSPGDAMEVSEAEGLEFWVKAQA